MRIVPFPDHGGAGPDEAWLADLEAALDGAGEGPAADSWRELREDVRALAPPMTADFERELDQRVAERGGRRRRLPGAGLRRPSTPIAAALATGMVALVAAIAVGTSGLPHSAPSPRAVSAPAAGPAVSSGEDLGPSKAGTARAGTRRSGESALERTSEAGVANPEADAAPGAGGAASAPGRVQQLGASLTLTATPADVQGTADRVSRLVVSDGGFVQSSHVQVQQAGASEASMMLSLPSAKLSAALASLERLAPVREESQSLQDITGSYDAARQRLADATAEHGALLRALAAAVSEAQIVSLRERLSQSASSIAHARSALAAVSQRASNAEVEVTVLGDAHVASEGLTLARGVHDAGRVLSVVLAALLVAAAALVPLVLVALALVSVRRAWRRYRREHALGPS
jgi:hypothetical protein